MEPSERLVGPGPARDTLQGGPARTSLLDRLATAWGRRGVPWLAFVVGALGGGALVWWWDDPAPTQVPTPAPRAEAAADPASSDVALILSDVEADPGRTGPAETADGAPLRIEGALLHSRGERTATVTRIHRPGASLRIRVGSLPVTLSANHPFERIVLQLSPRDCELATRWTPSSQPFLLSWTDDRGVVHEDVGGDHDGSLQLAMIRYLNAACDEAVAR